MLIPFCIVICIVYCIVNDPLSIDTAHRVERLAGSDELVFLISLTMEDSIF